MPAAQLKCTLLDQLIYISAQSVAKKWKPGKEREVWEGANMQCKAKGGEKVYIEAKIKERSSTWGQGNGPWLGRWTPTIDQALLVRFVVVCPVFPFIYFFFLPSPFGRDWPQHADVCAMVSWWLVPRTWIHCSQFSSGSCQLTVARKWENESSVLHTFEPCQDQRIVKIRGANARLTSNW